MPNLTPNGAPRQLTWTRLPINSRGYGFWALGLTVAFIGELRADSDGPAIQQGTAPASALA